MSLENLPPVTNYWDSEDLDGLTKEELEKLQIMLRLKMEAVTDRYERELFYKDRERFMLLKSYAYREEPKRDFPF
jgi:hypothetical protein